MAKQLHFREKKRITPISIEPSVWNFIRYYAYIELGLSASSLINQHFRGKMMKYDKIFPGLDYENMTFDNTGKPTPNTLEGDE